MKPMYSPSLAVVTGIAVDTGASPPGAETTKGFIAVHRGAGAVLARIT